MDRDGVDRYRWIVAVNKVLFSRLIRSQPLDLDWRTPKNRDWRLQSVIQIALFSPVYRNNGFAKPMKRLKLIYSSLIGKKILAAVTGAILFLFLISHVAGNLKVFTGTNDHGVPAIDEYGEFLRTAGHPVVPDHFVLWAGRIGLLVALIIHLVVVIQLALLNRKARPTGYAKSNSKASTWAARLMMYSGILLLIFIVFHILHFTTGTIQFGKFEEGKIYSNLYESFLFWPVAVFYVVAMIVVGFHLFHGVWSFFQTLGLDNPDRNKLLRSFAMVITLAIVVGFSSLPIAFATGMMSAPPSQSETTNNEGGN